MIPEELQKLQQWVCWQGIPDPSRPGKIKKIPINPRTGGNAQSNNPSTWTDYDTALAASKQYSGLGLMFANGYFGIDIDGVEQEIKAYKAGDNDNIVAEFIYTLESYAEYSQSGKGIHIICRGTLPEGGRRRGNVEMYQEGRFFIMTGNVAAEYGDILDCTETVKPLYAKYIGRNEQGSRDNAAASTPIDLDDEEIIEAATRSKQGAGFKALFDGLWQGLYTNQSDADLAFCNMLAFWFGRDKHRMDAVFRRSGLMRDKWDRRTSGDKTYGDLTLNKAIAGCQDVYTPGGAMDGYGLTIREQERVSEPVKLYSYDDTGNADRFVDQHQNDVRYSYIDKCWYTYTGRKWQVDRTGMINKLVDDLLPRLKQELAYCVDDDQEKAFNKHLKYTRSNKGKTAMIKEVQHRVSILPSDFDQDIWSLNTQSGILDLKQGTLSEHSYAQFMSKITNTEYSDKMDCPRWRQFLDDIFDGDQALIQYIQKAVGYSLTGSTQEQCMFICVGNGRNGKSTFLDTISDIMGDYAANIQPETIMVKQISSSANSDIARLKGARFVTTVEPNEGVRLNEGLVKQVTGGDRVTARQLYGQEFEYTPEFKIWMGTNHKPIIRGQDDGIWRRLHIIPFNVQIPKDKVDKTLKDKLRQEYVGILNWAVEGCLLWQRDGLEPPSIVTQAVSEYKTEMDVIAAFLDECTERGPGETRAHILYQAYKEWAKDNGQYIMSNTKFGLELNKRFNKVKDRNGWKYLGILLVDDKKPYQLQIGLSGE